MASDDRIFPGGWLVPRDCLQQYIQDYVRDKPVDGEQYRRDWLFKHWGKGKTATRKHNSKPPSSPDQIARDLGIPATLYPWVKHLPHRPYCSDDLSEGLHIRSVEQALAHRYIQHNPPAQVWSVVLDVDHRIDLQSLAEPTPNAIAINPKNGHGHLFYFLKAGVTRTQAGRQAPLQLLAAVERGLCVKMDADPQYVGLVSKNLVNSDWQVHSYHDQLWTLGQLAEYLDLDAAKARRYVPDTPEEAYQTGRNVYLFHTARKWAYSAIRDYWGPNGLPRWQEVVTEQIERLNERFPEPLAYSEVRAIGKSIAKWTWRHITPAGLQELIERTHTPEVQAERGRRGGLAATNQTEAGIASGKARRAAREQDRATARLLRAQGYSQREIAVELGVPRWTVRDWLS